MLEFLHHKNIETHYLVIILSYRAQSSELQVALRDYTIVGIEVGLFLVIVQYSCDEVLSGTVPIPSIN